MVVQGLVWPSNGWTRVERNPSSRSGIEGPFNHLLLLFFLNLPPQLTLNVLNIVLGAVFRGWYQRHFVGSIIGGLIITCLRRIFFNLLNLRMNLHATSWEVPKHCPLGCSLRWRIS
jgi:hypothetical protein